MQDHLRDQELGLIADRLDSEMLRGFFDRWTYRQTFAIEDKSLIFVPIYTKCFVDLVYIHSLLESFISNCYGYGQ